MSGCGDDGAGDRDPLLLAAGELGRPVAEPVGEVERGRERLVAVAVDRTAGELEGQQDVLPGGEHQASFPHHLFRVMRPAFRERVA